MRFLFPMSPLEIRTMTQSSASNPAAESPKPSRRQFMSHTAAGATAATLAASLPFARVAHAQGAGTLKVALVGCGGRGSGAAAQALTADKGNTLTALCDIFPDRIEGTLTGLKNEFPKQIADKVNKYDGFDGYKAAINDCDVVLLATSPHFRPMMVEEAVKQGKHMFVEKPVGTDVVNTLRCLEATKKAKEKNLAVVSGLCYRYQRAKQQTMEQIRNGAIGKIRAMYTYYYTTELWHRGNKPEWSEMEYQIRNWLYFTWLSGDHIVEQHIHSIDKCAWANGDKTPKAAVAIGGRSKRTGKEYGNIYDNFYVSFEYDDGVVLHSTCRQMNGTTADISDYVVGEKGTANLQSHFIKDNDGKLAWRCPRIPNDNMYQNEHDDFFKSIRDGKPINNGDYMAQSTLMAILGREAAYTGQKITWEQLLASKQDLSPKGGYKWGPNPVEPVAVPGVTKWV